MGLQRRSWCKINLLLNVLGKRPDGFHELETVLHPAPVFELLEFERAGRGVELTCSVAALSAGPSNLAHRAATAFLEAAGIAEGVRIRLEKHIPLAAGLGGGSGNAAATLLGLNELFGWPLAPAALAGLAAGLGSDVPFFLQTRPAVATGRGERVAPLDFFPALRGVWALLAHPGFGVQTGWAYEALARFPAALQGQPGRTARLIEQLGAGDLAAARAQFYNALEMPVLGKYPVLALYQEFLRAAGALATQMSGSGSTTFALARGEAAALRLREKFLARFGANCWTAVVELGGREA